MIFSCVFKRFFKSRKYTINAEDEEYEPSPHSAVFMKEDKSTPLLIQTKAALSPILWRYIFPSTPAHPADAERDDEVAEWVSRQSHTRSSASSSAGYCSQSGSSSSSSCCSYDTPGLGAASGESSEIHTYDVAVCGSGLALQGTSPADKRTSIWGDADFTPEPPFRVHNFARHEHKKRSLHRMPSAPVSGTVRQMVKFFESDSERALVPRRLDKMPPEFMRSCPQMLSTPSPIGGYSAQEVHATHSDLIRGVMTSSHRCTRCNVHYRTPTSRRSIF